MKLISIKMPRPPRPRDPLRCTWGKGGLPALPAQPEAWGDTWPRSALGCALVIAAVVAWSSILFR